TEGLFARIEHFRDATTDHWEVRSKDGLVSFYGTPVKAGVDPAVIADPSNRAKVFSWKLTLTKDPSGNRNEYLYERDTNSTAKSHHWDQVRLSEIRYIDYGERLDPQFLVKVRFSYENRPDHFSEYRAGFEIRTIQRCVRIEVLVSETSGDILSRTYHLEYLD